LLRLHAGRGGVVSYPAMRRLRQHFSWIVTAWLLCQASVAVLVPASLCARDIVGAQQACTCSHNDGQECPMHHTRSKSPASCSCRSSNDGLTATLASLFGPAAVLTPGSAVVAIIATTDFGTNPDATLVDTSFNPDPPPPRA
jgi:hypothetical protein